MAQRSAGYGLIDLIFTIGLLSILMLIAMGPLLKARQQANASSAIGSLRAINSAELTFALTCGGGFYAPDLTTLGTAPVGSREAFVGPDLGASDPVTKAGYVIQLDAAPFATAPTSCNGLALGAAGQSYRAAADPTEPGNPRFFATNADGLLWEDNTTLFAVMPETGEPPSGHVLR